ncbi:uncharacterized protein LOC143072386 isoform X1 [Mytilus galloprovincialis]|uniref:uncharacterized protein LOC143072386 isoform X1 n=1 Tax=Mytilus galloprovincialis TaxID=29158 RepID=UPI003F7BB9C4
MTTPTKVQIDNISFTLMLDPEISPDMSKSSLDDLMMDRRGYLPPLRAPYDTDFSYNNNRSSFQAVGNQQFLATNPPDRINRNSGERLSSEYVQTSNDKLFFEELLRRQQRWVMGIMESSFRRITDDIMRTSNVVRRHDSVIHDLNSSYTKLDKYYGAVVQDLTTRSNNCDKRIKEINEDIKQNKDTIEKLVQQASHDKKEIEDHILKNNAEYILELSKVRTEIEGLRTSYKKDITVSDERRRIEMDDARSRISALDSYTKNALHTLKNAVQEALGRTENKITDGIKEERMVWRQNMDSVQKHSKEQMERLDQSISIIEDEAKRLIDAVVKKLESVQDIVTTEKSTNEEFRKVVKNYMDTSKVLSERLTVEVNSLKEESGNKVQGLETNIESLRSVVEGRYSIVMEQVKKENERLDKQIQQLSRQVQTLQQQVVGGVGTSGSG